MARELRIFFLLRVNQSKRKNSLTANLALLPQNTSISFFKSSISHRGATPTVRSVATRLGFGSSTPGKVPRTSQHEQWYPSRVAYYVRRTTLGRTGASDQPRDGPGPVRTVADQAECQFRSGFVPRKYVI